MSLLRNKWAISTISLGQHPSHTLERKIRAAHAHGFDGIELVYADLVPHSVRSQQSTLESAKQIGKLCASLQIAILSLTPFKNYEGNLDSALEDRLHLARQWTKLAKAVGASCLQMPSQFLPNSTPDRLIVVSELQALADLAAEDGIAVAYEAVAFAQWNPYWQDALEIVLQVDRQNFKLCLDSFHIHARLWGDACSGTGKLPGGDEALKQSMTELVTACPKSKVHYLQLSDASRFDPPLPTDSPLFHGLESKDPRLVWSRTARPFPLEHPGYFPVIDITQDWITAYGWEGWLSLEGFLLETREEHNGPEVMAARAARSVRDVCKHLRVQVPVKISDDHDPR